MLSIIHTGPQIKTLMRLHSILIGGYYERTEEHIIEEDALKMETYCLCESKTMQVPWKTEQFLQK